VSLTVPDFELREAPPRSVVVPSRARRSVAKPVAADPTPEAVAPLQVKLLTDDPNVIIYWLFDEKGD
jgi:hypothetical protein